MIFVPRDRSSKPPDFDSLRTTLRRDHRAQKKADQTHTISMFWKQRRRRLGALAQALGDIFHHKCAYCEAKPEHVSFSNIEHYRPMSKFEELAFDWENWLYSCGRCNQVKWAHFPMCGDQPCLLDPARDHPSIHLGFMDEAVVGLTERGRETIRLVRLDRSELESERRLWLMAIDLLLLLAAGDHTEAAVEARRMLIWSMQPDAPYSACSWAYLATVAPKLARPRSPHTQVNVREPMARIRELVADARSVLGDLK